MDAEEIYVASLAREEQEAKALEARSFQALASLPLREARDAFEKMYLEGVVIEGETVSNLARRLGISRPTAYDLLDKHGVVIPLTSHHGERLRKQAWMRGYNGEYPGPMREGSDYAVAYRKGQEARRIAG